MRTTIIPAQITTVEDTIAGNLNLTQILILMVPIFWTALVYTLLPKAMHLGWYKILLILFVLFACLILSLRIQGKVVVHWLIILLTYNLRPKYYLLNKNDSYMRTLHLPVFEKKPFTLFKLKKVKQETKQIDPVFSISKFVMFENFLNSSKYSISYKTGRRGGINVAFREIQK